eukprot:scaffold284363_cov32-Tisochrysis_lutea.AAC.5
MSTESDRCTFIGGAAGGRRDSSPVDKHCGCSVVCDGFDRVVAEAGVEDLEGSAVINRSDREERLWRRQVEHSAVGDGGAQQPHDTATTHPQHATAP